MDHPSTAPRAIPDAPLEALRETAVALVVARVPHLQALYCFGSAADGVSRPGSDVDLAVLAAAPLDPLDRWKLQEELAALLGRDVDLVDLRAASTVMRVQVLASDVLLVDPDPSARAWFEMLALSDYARLNEDRRAILADVKDRGRVYFDDVILNKAAVIERCLRRVREEHAGDDTNLLGNITRQDSIILNLQRACEAAIDLAMHLVRIGQLGIPQESRDAFNLLSAAGVVGPDLAQRLRAMVGFRNLAVHDYQEQNMDIVLSIIHSNLTDIEEFARLAVDRA